MLKKAIIIVNQLIFKTGNVGCLKLVLWDYCIDPSDDYVYNTLQYIYIYIYWSVLK
jgi:hypothetical protein